MDFHTFYRSKAPLYDRLVEAEDADGRLSVELARHAKIVGADVVEVGVGTGRLTALLVEVGARSVVGVEPEPAMLDIARQKLARAGSECRLEFHVGDAFGLPVHDAVADLVIAGWVFAHFRGFFPERWRAKVDDAIAEAMRAVRPGGALVLIDTLGTGNEEPCPPSAALEEYYTYLEQAHGFRRTWTRTDYAFATEEEAVELCGAFFGQTLLQEMEAQGWGRRVPECTGIWSCQRADWQKG